MYSVIFEKSSSDDNGIEDRKVINECVKNVQSHLNYYYSE